MPRIFSRAKSAMVSLACLLNSRSPKAPRKGRPPLAQASSYRRRRSSAVASRAGAGVDREVEAGRPRARLGAQRRIVGLHLRARARDRAARSRPAPNRWRVRWNTVSALGLLGDQRDRLDGRRARADHADLEPGEVDAFLGPFAGVPDRSLEIGHALERRLVGRRQATHRHQAEARLDPIAPLPSAFSVSTIQRALFSSKVAAITRVEKRMSRRRSKRSATWLA